MQDESFLRLPEVIRRTGKSRARIYHDVKAGSFPRPVKIGLAAIGWPKSAIDAWIAERIAASGTDKKAA